MNALLALVALLTLVSARAAAQLNIVSKMNRSHGTKRLAVVSVMELQAKWQRQTGEFTAFTRRTAARQTGGLRP